MKAPVFWLSIIAVALLGWFATRFVGNQYYYFAAYVVLQYVVLSTAWISSVAPERETVVMNIEKKRIQEAPEYKPDADFSREYETKLHDYYRFPYYWL